ncbi:hypothetical protein QTP88_010175 [Uroleucon formosanum]
MKKIKDKEITLREAAGHGIAGHQGFNRCNCKTGCGTKKCACNAAEMLCSSKCHEIVLFVIRSINVRDCPLAFGALVYFDVGDKNDSSGKSEKCSITPS